MDNIINEPMYHPSVIRIREEVIGKLLELEERYKQEAEPYIKILSDIEARTPRRIIMPMSKEQMRSMYPNVDEKK